MSRTQRRSGGSSPIKRYLRYSGATGLFNYWDKDAQETVEVESITLTILDVKSSISGYMESKGAQISSNMVTDMSTEPMKVVAFANKKPYDIAEGLYKDIKEKVTAKEVGGKFTANIIGLADVGFGEEIVNLQLAGVALGSWIDFTNEYPNDSFYDYKVTLVKGDLSKRSGGETVSVSEKEEEALEAKIKKNPKTPRPVWFYVIDLSVEDLSEAEIEKAIKSDEKLQEYFGAVKEAPTTKEDSTANVTGASEPTATEEEEDDLPF